MFEAFCSKKSLDIATLRFMSPTGDRFGPSHYDKTAEECDLEDEDAIGTLARAGAAVARCLLAALSPPASCSELL